METPGQPKEQSFEQRIPDGDDRLRRVCSDCGFVDYENPKVVVGAVATWGDKILLCRRAIEPRVGYWTLPAGYLEVQESAIDGACREAWEEARAKLDIDQLLAVYAIPRISQIQLIYRARLVSPDVSAGPETQELDLFAWDDIPWNDIAFPSVHWALNDFYAVRDLTSFAPRSNPIGETGDM
ncbi:NUDIX hydrolase [Pelagibius sp. Alg239-R121]|uniref:NUDIX hydrolase n=1 Tax=Pelagibius sp. Alg239-R121 TaxID=2993448 RepID=UPI0024A6967A|nr:NUDIX hydrolase [Pelagibius sp. Alg239-R121]